MKAAAQVYAMLGNQTLWQVAETCHELLRKREIPYAVVGGVAVCMHGYQRNTVDLDLLVRREDTDLIRRTLEENGFHWSSERCEFRSSAGTPVQFLLAGDRAGEGGEVRLPDPGEASSITELEGLPVLSLSKLIEAKIACGLGNMRRTHKDFADVVELIAAHNLSRSFARHLHKSVRQTFRELVLNARGA